MKMVKMVKEPKARAGEYEGDRCMKAFRKNNAGFSLLELMIVTGIVGVISTIAYGSYISYFRSAKTAEIPLLSDGLFVAEASYNILAGDFVEAGPMSVNPSNPGSLSGQKLANSRQEIADNEQFKTIGFVPIMDLYGSIQTVFPGPRDPYYDAKLAACKCNINIYVWQDLNDDGVLEEYIQNARKDGPTDNTYKYDQSGAIENARLKVKAKAKGDNGKHLGWYK